MSEQDHASRRTFLAGAGALTLGLTTAGIGLARTPAAARTRARVEPRRELRLTGMPEAESERLRLGNALRTTDMHTPTGLRLPANTDLTVRVGDLEGNAEPVLYVGAPVTHPDEKFDDPRSYPLAAGSNTVNDPGGGMLYLGLVGTDEQRASVVIGDAALPAPMFVLDETTPAQFRRQLREYGDAPYVELVSAGAITTVTLASARSYADQDQAVLMRQYDQVIASHAVVSGLDGSGAAHRRSPLPFHLVEVQRMVPGAWAYATHGFTAYPLGDLQTLLSVRTNHDDAWGQWHELGHQHQQMAYKPGALTEVTVNLYSLGVQRLRGLPSRLTVPETEGGPTAYDLAFELLDRGDFDWNADTGPWERLVMLRQLTLAFGEDFWPRMHRLVREESPDPGEDEQRFHHLGVLASRVSEHDLSDFLRRWRLPVPERTYQSIAELELPPPPVDPSELRE